jgi:hypothetical protein
MRLFALPLFLLTACVTESNFDTVTAAQFCDSFETCNASTFNATFDDQAACTDKAETFFGCYQENCTTFDAKAANECLVTFPTQSDDCDGSQTDPTNCSEAWSDCDSVGLALCAAGAVFGG